VFEIGEHGELCDDSQWDAD
jgi:hypothetical protein